MINHTITETPADSWRLVFWLILSGGIQDSYTFCVRDHVLSNAQTGNVVFLGHHLFLGGYKRFSPLPAPHYSLRFRSLFCCPLTKPVGKASAYRLAEKYPSSGNCLPLYCRTPPLLFKPPGKHPRLLFLWSAGPLFHQIE